MKQADRIGGRVIRAEGIGTDEFGQPVGLMRLRAAHGPHLVQDDGNAGFRRLPCCFRAGKSAANDVDGFDGHDRHIERFTAIWNRFRVHGHETI